MPSIHSMFPSKFLRADDLPPGQPVTVVIDRVVVEVLQEETNEQKPVMYFRDKDKGMVLNKTNAETIAYAYGDDTDGWPGKTLELRNERVNFKGRMVAGLRCYPQAQTRTPPPAPTAPPAAFEELDDDIPF